MVIVDTKSWLSAMQISYRASLIPNNEIISFLKFKIFSSYFKMICHFYDLLVMYTYFYVFKIHILLLPFMIIRKSKDFIFY